MTLEIDDVTFQFVIEDFEDKIWLRNVKNEFSIICENDQFLISKLEEINSSYGLLNKIFNDFKVLYAWKNQKQKILTTSTEILNWTYRVEINRYKENNIFNDQFTVPKYLIDISKTTQREEEDIKIGLNPNDKHSIGKHNYENGVVDTVYYYLAKTLLSSRIKNCISLLRHLLTLDKDLFAKTSFLINNIYRNLGEPEDDEQLTIISVDEVLNDPEKYLQIEQRTELLAEIFSRYMLDIKTEEELWSWDTYINQSFDKLGVDLASLNEIISKIEDIHKKKTHLFPKDWQENIKVRLDKSNRWYRFSGSDSNPVYKIEKITVIKTKLKQKSLNNYIKIDNLDDEKQK